jgi:hypothetical protein
MSSGKFPTEYYKDMVENKYFWQGRSQRPGRGPAHLRSERGFHDTVRLYQA